MSNVDRPFGLVPIGTTDGSDYHGKMRDLIFRDAGVNGFIGDLVEDGAEAIADKYPVVEQATAGSTTLVGAIVSIYPDFTDEGSLISNYADGDDDRTVKVCQGNSVVYVAQADDDTDAMIGSDIGGQVDFIVGAGDTISGISGMELDSSTAIVASSPATEPLSVQGFNELVGNVLADNGTAASVTNGGLNGLWNVVINNAFKSLLIGGVAS